MRTVRWMLQEIIVVLLWQGILLVGNTDSMAAKVIKSAGVPNTGKRSGGRSFEFARRLRQGRAPGMLVQRGNTVREWSLSDYVVYRRAADRKRRENPPGFDHITATGHSPTRPAPLNIGEGATTPATVSTPASRCYYYGCSDDDAGPPACYFTLQGRDVPPNVPCVCVCSGEDANTSDLTTPVPSYSNDYEDVDFAAALSSRTPRRGDVNNSISVIVFLVIYMFVVIGYLKLTVKWY